MIPRHAIDSMTCSMCQNGLSVFPIHSYGERHMTTCGRCPTKEDFLPQREHLYEQLAQHIEFSCRFQINGCIVKLKPAELEAHENICPHKPCLCPILPIGTCKWQGSFKDVYEHCRDSHPALAFNNFEVEVNIVNSYEVNYVIEHTDQIFIVKLKCDLTNNKIYCNVLSWDVKPAKKKLSYCVNFVNNTTKFTCDPQAVSFCNLSEFPNDTDTTSASIDDIIANLNNPTCIICKIDIIVSSINSASNISNTIDGDRMLKTLECPICLEYMVPPILQCSTGHSFCGSHKHKINKCPTCNADIGETRNYILEEIASKIIQYPCKYNNLGCLYSSKADNIRAHESMCTFGPYKCIVTGCAWENSFSELKSHLTEEHKDNIVEISSITYILDLFNDSCSYIIFSYCQIFKLLFKKIDNNFIWSLQIVGVDNIDDDATFMLELDFASQGKERIYMTHECIPLCEDDGIQDEQCVKLETSQLKHFIDDDTLTYKVRVIQCL